MLTVNTVKSSIYKGILKHKGFKKVGSTSFNRRVGSVAQSIQFQKSRFGDYFYINYLLVFDEVCVLTGITPDEGADVRHVAECGSFKRLRNAHFGDKWYLEHLEANAIELDKKVEELEFSLGQISSVDSFVKSDLFSCVGVCMLKVICLYIVGNVEAAVEQLNALSQVELFDAEKISKREWLRRYDVEHLSEKLLQE